MKAKVRDDSSQRDAGIGVKGEATDASLIVQQYLCIDIRLDPCGTVAYGCHDLEERRVTERRETVQVRALERYRVQSKVVLSLTSSLTSLVSGLRSEMVP